MSSKICSETTFNHEKYKNLTDEQFYRSVKNKFLNSIDDFLDNYEKEETKRLLKSNSEHSVDCKKQIIKMVKEIVFLQRMKID